MTELSTTLIESFEEYNTESKQPMHLTKRMYCFNAVQDNNVTALIVAMGSKRNLMGSLSRTFLLFSQAENMTEVSTTLTESLE